MYFESNRRCEFKSIQYDKRNKWIKHISCECRCEFYGRKCNSKQNWNSTYTKSLIDDLVVLSDEILDTENIASANSTDKTNIYFLVLLY